MSAPLQHALLVGQGRSGTNYLLALLDQSRATHCRNEPDQLDGGALARLAPFRFFVDDAAELARLYEPAVRRAARCIGPRDRALDAEKDWLRPGARRLGTFLLRQRWRVMERLVRRRAPMDGREHAFPRWMADHAALERALHVFKLNAAAGTAAWALGARADARVVHIVRHPGGFVRSWRARWVRGEGGMGRGRGTPDALDDAQRLRELARRDARWAARLGDVGAMGAAERELAWWRWTNETLAAAGAGRPGYVRVLYEELAREPERVAGDVYRALGLAYDARVAARVRALSVGSERLARAWEDALEPELVALVERVLAGSPMERWWSDAAA